MNHSRSTALERSVKITGELKPVLRDPNLALIRRYSFTLAIRQELLIIKKDAKDSF